MKIVGVAIKLSGQYYRILGLYECIGFLSSHIVQYKLRVYNK